MAVNNSLFDLFFPSYNLRSFETKTTPDRIVLNVAGYDENDFEVTILGHDLDIGSKNGKIVRLFTLDDNVDVENISFSVSKGLMTIMCPRLVKKEVKRVIAPSHQEVPSSSAPQPNTTSTSAPQSVSASEWNARTSSKSHPPTSVPVCDPKCDCTTQKCPPECECDEDDEL